MRERKGGKESKRGAVPEKGRLKRGTL